MFTLFYDKLLPRSQPSPLFSAYIYLLLHISISSMLTYIYYLLISRPRHKRECVCWYVSVCVHVCVCVLVCVCVCVGICVCIYILLQRIMMRITKKRFMDWCPQEIFSARLPCCGRPSDHSFISVPECVFIDLYPNIKCTKKGVIHCFVFKY
jgi:hypothetical protein